MTISAHISPSNLTRDDHGHMTVSWQNGIWSLQCRGYYPFIEDLPEMYQLPKACREYLLNNTVPGQVLDDKPFRDRIEAGDENIISMSWQLESSLITQIQQSTQLGMSGLYSFNPDTFPGADNCVTWSIKILNSLLGEVLQPVPQGRISLAARQLSKLSRP